MSREVNSHWQMLHKKYTKPKQKREERREEIGKCRQQSKETGVKFKG
ncbi:hypothetical protein M5D96_010541, partial [Drosophila gunungcola]